MFPNEADCVYFCTFEEAKLKTVKAKMKQITMYF